MSISLCSQETSEFVKLMNGYKSRNPSQESRSSKLFVPQVNASLPTQVDWRTKGYVTRVKSQVGLGYAFHDAYWTMATIKS